MLGLRGRTAVVTGGSDGIGKACALALAGAGARVVVAARRPEPLAAVVAELRGLGAEALGVQGDIRQPGTVERLVEEAVEAFATVDVLVNNVGASYSDDFRRLPLLELEPRELLAAVDLNVASAFACSKAVAPMMLQRGGAIVNIGSIVASHPVPGFGFYSPAKAALISLTQLMALEWAPQVRVNAVLPGHIDTARSSSLRTPETVERLLRGIAMERLGTPADVAGAVVFLASDLARWTTGALLDVNGGLRAISI